jgi:hypothetical protein
MITRFRLEVAGDSQTDCMRQLEAAALGIFDMDGSNREDWDITDDVSWKNGAVYCARVVMKLKTNPDSAQL